jgi:hypothetical protein
MFGAALRSTTIGVFYLARGADEDSMTKFQAFRDSYHRWQAGVGHQLYVIFKGFTNAAGLTQARDVFRDLPHRAIYTEDDAFDLGAYFVAASRVEQENVCFLNTASEICGSNWLLKLAVNFQHPGVGIVGCTASYEAPQHPGMDNVAFPNPHLRSNSFMIRRDRFLAARPDGPLKDKIDAHLFEHGSASLTRRIASQGLKTLLVGKNGRGYEPDWWVGNQTFRQGAQANLLIADNQTKAFEKASLAEKRFLFQLAWGDGAVGQVHSLVTGRSQQIMVSHANDSDFAEAQDGQSAAIKSLSLPAH